MCTQHSRVQAMSEMKKNIHTNYKYIHNSHKQQQNVQRALTEKSFCVEQTEK